MDKQRLRIALKVLGAVKEKFPDTKQFIEDLIDEECQKESLQVLKQRVISEKHFLFCSEYVKRHFIKLNLLGYEIFY